MSETQTIALSLEQVEDFEFRIRFDGTELAALETDEPAPLGNDAGPNPTRLLLSAVANCLAASLLFALRKFKNEPGQLKATASANMERNEDKRWRIASMQVKLQLADNADALEKLPRILEQFENFCVVTQSVRQGIDVDVSVLTADGECVHSTRQTTG